MLNQQCLFLFCSALVGLLLVEMPVVDYENQWNRKNANVDEIASIDTWHWWNKFRQYSDYNPRFQLALELTADLPSKNVLLRWMGEAVNVLIIPISLFINNSNNYPVLPYHHKNMTLKFLAKTNCKLALKTTEGDDRILQNHVDYLRFLYKENAKRRDPMVE